VTAGVTAKGLRATEVLLTDPFNIPGDQIICTIVSRVDSYGFAAAPCGCATYFHLDRVITDPKYHYLLQPGRTIVCDVRDSRKHNLGRLEARNVEACRMEGDPEPAGG
jgi:hypothetical protein